MTFSIEDTLALKPAKKVRFTPDIELFRRLGETNLQPGKEYEVKGVEAVTLGPAGPNHAIVELEGGHRLGYQWLNQEGPGLGYFTKNYNCKCS